MLPQPVSSLFDMVTRGVDQVSGRQYLPAPATPATGGSWSNFTNFAGGQRSQIWGVAKHAGCMYFGVGGDSDGAAQIWRHDGSSWSNVSPPAWSAAQVSEPVLTMRVPSLLSSGGYIYATTASAGYATQIWRSVTGAAGTWQMCLNFGTSVSNLLSLTEYNGHLYVCVNRAGGAPGEVWSSSNAWATPIKTVSGTLAYCMKVHCGELYLGTGYPAEVFKFDGATWSQISNFNDSGLSIVETMTSYRGDLVVAFGRNYWQDPAPPCVTSWDGLTWEPVGDTQPGEWRASHNFNSSVVMNDTLMVSMGSSFGDVSLWALSNGKDWVKVGGRPSPFGEDITGSTFKGEWIYGLCPDGQQLYVCFASIQSSTEPAVWKYTAPTP